MLTRELLRYRRQGDRLRPAFLRPGGGAAELAERLLALWRLQLGGKRRDLEEGVGLLVRQSRSTKVARGLNRVIERRAAFAEAADARPLRDRALADSARRLAAPAPGSAEHRRAVAAACEVSPAELSRRLYADLPAEAELVEVPDWDAEGLLGRYNLELLQGLLVHAGELRVRLDAADPGQRRRILKAMRFHHLLARVEPADDEALTLRIGGPAQVLEQSTRYGSRLACFVPHLLSLPRWWLAAELILPREDGPLLLDLDQDCRLRAFSQFSAYVPPELRALRERLERTEPGWRVDEDAPPLRAADGELVVPDFRVHLPGRTWSVECFHRWHAAALERRLRQRAAGELPDLVLGVDRGLLKRKAFAHLVDAADPPARVFAFTGFPAARGLRKALAKDGE